MVEQIISPVIIAFTFGIRRKDQVQAEFYVSAQDRVFTEQFVVSLNSPF